MSYLVLARKYRPQLFSDVIGQELIVSTLSKALSTGRIAHAFLLTGSRGTGKTTVARILARSLSCQQGISDKPCGRCSPCLEILAGSCMDVIEIDGASNTGVDDVRELRDNTRYPPSVCRFKIFIIDEVHMLSTNAFNALLKTLEEPPPHVKFIFATTEPHKIPITILSRCQRYDFRRIPTQDIVKHLRHVLSQENASINDDALMLIARAAQGGMRDALSLCDQVLSFSTQNPSIQDVARILGIIDRNLVWQSTKAIVKGDTHKALDLLNEAYASGQDLKELSIGIAEEMRHLCIASTLKSLQGFADLPSDDITLVDTLAKEEDPADLQRLFAMALDTVDQIAHASSTKLALELAFLKMADRPKMAEASSILAAISRLEALSKGQSISVAERITLPAPPEAFPQKSAVQAPKQAASQEQEDETQAEEEYSASPMLEGIDQRWFSFTRAVAQKSHTLAAHLEQGHLRGEEVFFKSNLHYEAVLAVCEKAGFQALFKRFFGEDKSLRAVYEEEENSLKDTLSIYEAKDLAEQKALAALESKASDDPLVQKAIALFGGEIRSVRQMS